LQHLLHLSAFFFRATSGSELHQLFPEFGRDRGGRATGHFGPIAFEELQENLEIILHGKKILVGGLEAAVM
jgi:hypothetical protein